MGIWYTVFVCGGLGALLTAGTVLAPVNPIRMYELGETRMAGPAFFAAAPKTVLAGFLLVGLACLTAAYGVYAKRPWSRPTLLSLLAGFFLLGALAGETDLATLVSILLFGAILCAALAWYLYRKTNVAAYFNPFHRHYR